MRFVVREELPNRERFFGYGMGHTGNFRMLYVDYPLVDGARLQEPEGGGRLHRVYTWPVEPYGDLIDLGSLRSEEGSSGAS